MNSGALLCHFCSPFIKVEHQSSLEKSLNLTTVELSWHFAFVAAGKEHDFGSCFSLLSDGKQKVHS